jgi:hypothetical protein
MRSLSPPPHPHPSRVRAILEWVRTIHKLKENYLNKIKKPKHTPKPQKSKLLKK